MTIAPPLPPGAAGAGPPRRRSCARHERREAVGRCVDCGGGFCRECVTEHGGRLYCAPCFARRAGAAGGRPRGAAGGRLRDVATTAGSLFLLLGAFYLAARLLAAVPPELHDGTVWREVFDER